MDREVAGLMMNFLQRVQLQGAEVFQYLRCINELQRTLSGPETGSQHGGAQQQHEPPAQVTAIHKPAAAGR